MPNTIKVAAYVAKMFNEDTGERILADKRKFFWKDFSVEANNKSEALTKVGRQVSANELIAENYQFV